MIVVYYMHNEVLVCEEEDEEQLLKEYFVEGKRDMQEYERMTTTTDRRVVEIEPGNLMVSL